MKYDPLNHSFDGDEDCFFANSRMIDGNDSRAQEICGTLPNLGIAFAQHIYYALQLFFKDDVTCGNMPRLDWSVPKQ